MNKIDLETSLAVGGAVYAKARECWLNAWRALANRYRAELAPHVPDGSVYVEGFAYVGAIIPIHHGWVETPAGVTIDPTVAAWVLTERGPVAEWGYWPVVKLNLTEATYRAADRGFPIVNLRQPKTRGLEEAHLAAWDHAIPGYREQRQKFMETRKNGR